MAKSIHKTNIAKQQSQMKRRLRTRNNLEAWVLLIPMVFVFYVFVWRPTVMGFVWSFFKMKGYTPKEFVGFENYIRVLTHTKFLSSLWNTVKYVLWSLVIGFLPPVFIAIMLNEMVHFKSCLRTMTYLPVIIPGIAAMLMWYYIYYPDQTGLLNVFLAKFGIQPQMWLNDARFSIVGIIIFKTWKGFGASCLLYLASLQSVSVELYEAAMIDGAGPWKRMWYITRPAIEGLLLLNFVRQIIGVFQIMEEPLAMTGGGPNGATSSLAYMLYEYGFNSGGKATGQAMALGVVIFAILMVATCFYFWMNKKVQDRY